MLVLDEIRASASAKADAHLSEIISLAFGKLANSGWSRRLQPIATDRWTALRRRQVSPANELEEQYLRFVWAYTKAKITLMRYQNSRDPYPIQWGALEDEIVKWRNCKDAIEMGLEYIGASPPIATNRWTAQAALEIIKFAALFPPSKNTVPGKPIAIGDAPCSSAESVTNLASREKRLSQSLPKPGTVCTPTVKPPVPLPSLEREKSETIQEDEAWKRFAKSLPTPPVRMLPILRHDGSRGTGMYYGSPKKSSAFQEELTSLVRRHQCILNDADIKFSKRPTND